MNSLSFPEFNTPEHYWLVNACVIFLISLICTGMLIPRILHVAFSKHLFDEVNARKIHKGAVPRLGGMAFVPVIIFAVMLMTAVNLTFGYAGLAGAVVNNGVLLLYCCCALLMLYIVGLGDDLVGVRYRTKFAVQVICAFFMMAGGLYMHSTCGLFGVYDLPLWLGIILTVLTAVLIINAINLIDGIDGLASGLAMIALTFYAILFFRYEVYDASMIALATLGVVTSFFYFNVFGDANRYKKIFMGDTGSLTLGFLLTVLAFRALMLPEHAGPYPNANRFVLAFSPLIIPCFDVVRVFVERIRNHSNPFLPDQRHIHHMLMACGIRRRSCMILILAMAVAFILISTLLVQCISITLVLLVDIIIYLGLILLLRHRRKVCGSKNAA